MRSVLSSPPHGQVSASQPPNTLAPFSCQAPRRLVLIGGVLSPVHPRTPTRARTPAYAHTHAHMHTHAHAPHSANDSIESSPMRLSVCTQAAAFTEDTRFHNANARLFSVRNARASPFWPEHTHAFRCVACVQCMHSKACFIPVRRTQKMPIH